MNALSSFSVSSTVRSLTMEAQRTADIGTLSKKQTVGGTQFKGLCL